MYCIEILCVLWTVITFLCVICNYSYLCFQGVLPLKSVKQKDITKFEPTCCFWCLNIKEPRHITLNISRELSFFSNTSRSCVEDIGNILI